MFTTLILSLILSSAAQAQESTLSTPQVTLAPSTNRPGLRNKAAWVVTYGPDGCPLGYTFGGQHMTAEEYETIMGAGAAARVDCTIAKARASAIEDRAEADLVRAKADYGATLLLASAGADVARIAGDDGAAVYINANNGVVATHNAAPLAAVDGNLGATVLNPWVTRGAMDLDALAAINGGFIAPPVTAPVTTPAPQPTAPPKPKPPQATVSEAESRILGIE